MTEVFFYHGASDRIAAATALLSGAYDKRKAVTVFAPDRDVAEAIDRSLWSSSQLSFIPHCRADSPLAAETPILIADGLEGIPPGERLMNLGRDIPVGFDRFQSLIEVVGQADDDRAAARERVRRYRELGHEVRYFDLSNR